MELNWTLSLDLVRKRSKFVVARLSLLWSVCGFVLLCGLAENAQAEWTIDWSRRQGVIAPQKPAVSASRFQSESASVVDPVAAADNALSVPTTESSFLDKVLQAGTPVQDVIILHTAKGFVPNVLRVRKDGRYRFHVVNVNAQEKNVSFILDGFSENHATAFGQPKSFLVEPKRQGAYSFMSPETGIEGQMIVIGSEPIEPPPVQSRLPAQAATGVQQP